MMGRTHLLLGFNSLWVLELANVFLPHSSFFAGANTSVEWDTFAPCLVAAGVGALLPDLDASSSLLQNLSVGGIRPLVLPARALHGSLGHRGALHSLSGLGIVGLFALLLLPFPLLLSPSGGANALLWFSLLLGFLSHLLGDACTKSGVPLFYPRRKKVHLLPRALRLSTGSAAEEAWFAAAAIGAATLLLRHLVPASWPVLMPLS